MFPLLLSYFFTGIDTGLWSTFCFEVLAGSCAGAGDVVVGQNTTNSPRKLRQSLNCGNIHRLEEKK